jgi:hypothetical protein
LRERPVTELAWSLNFPIDATRSTGEDKMSIDFISDTRIAISDLFDGRLEKYGIWGATKNGNGHLFDKTGSVTVYGDDDNSAFSFTSYGFSDPTNILVAIQNEFQTRLFSENEPQYWGFGTVEEWENSTEWFNTKGN